MGKRLLVVDSDRRFIQDQKVPLESAFEVDFLFATEGALTKLETGAYGAVLVCVETSENKGYALCSAIRRSAQATDLKVALISAKASEEEYARHRGTKGKADLYLHKPIASASLIPALAELVPMREDDPDNPLGDLAGADLGEEWLESLKTELDTELPPPLPAPTPVAQVLAPAPVWAPEPAPERTVKNAGHLELMEWRVQDLETKLATRYEEIEAKNREIQELLQQNAAVTRNLDEIQQNQTETEQLRRQVVELDRTCADQRGQLDAAAAEAQAQADRLEEAQVLLAEKTRQNAELMETHQLLQAQLEEAWEAGDQIKTLRAELTEAQEATRTLEARAGVAEQRCADLQADLDGAREQLADRVARVQVLEASLGRIQDLEGELASVREQAAFQEQTLRNLAEERGGLQADRDRQEDQIHEQAGEILLLQEKLTLLEGSARDAQEQRDRLLEAKTQLEAGAADLERRLEAAQAAHEAQQRELLAGIDEREAALGRLSTTVEAQREQVAQLDQERQALAERLRSRDTRLQTLTDVLTELEGKARQALDLSQAVGD